MWKFNRKLFDSISTHVTQLYLNIKSKRSMQWLDSIWFNYITLISRASSHFTHLQYEFIFPLLLHHSIIWAAFYFTAYCSTMLFQPLRFNSNSVNAIVSCMQYIHSPSANVSFRNDLLSECRVLLISRGKNGWILFFIFRKSFFSSGNCVSKWKKWAIFRIKKWNRRIAFGSIRIIQKKFG